MLFQIFLSLNHLPQSLIILPLLHLLLLSDVNGFILSNESMIAPANHERMYYTH